ncbi:hypothetical protein Q5Y75_05590 [Ruegeria sp. 2205SS24-7]|uniref:hypothetical protein n=1 Tax=Ruegeria discodermiae TaxID=3064389 RepID=UPI002742745B|nr:hypothetical protein [Ruegeria sp. 2205SS24-7]MDP5216683.1 hypothetical protein [Ruegeria sp. 2205SS24-7]
MAYDLKMKQGDVGVTFPVSLTNPDGTAVAFVSDDVATLNMRRIGAYSSDRSYNITATMDKDIGESTCSYTFTTADTDVPGIWEATVSVAFDNGVSLTWPEVGTYRFLIDPAI